MRRLTTTALIATAAYLWTSGRPAAQQINQAPQSPVAVLATTISDLRLWDANVTEGSRSGALRLRSTERDPMLPSRSVERYEQFLRGVRIWGADVVRDSENGVPISIFGMLAPDLSISTDPTLAAQDARDALLRAAGDDPLLLTEPELLVFAPEGNDYRLAYMAVVSGNGEVLRLFVDAHTGLELLRYSERKRQSGAVGTGTGVLGDRKKISVQSEGNMYLTVDHLRPPIIQTFDMRGNLTRTKALERGTLPYLPSDIARDADNVWTDVSVVDAHVHVSWTYDFFFKRFGRSGLDGRNGPIYIVVNAVSQQAAERLPPSDLNYAVNAGWCGVCGPGGQGSIFFGNGLPPDVFFTDTGRNYTYFSGALDIAAHELTHAVTEATSDLIYLNESGALNESFSDAMGKSVEFFFHPPGNDRGQANYVLGKDIARGIVPGALDGDRSMENPGLYGDPDHYSRRFRGREDNGGVHINSGIPNQAFYLAIEGGTNRTSGLGVQGVGAANREQIEKIFYRAFTLLMPRNATFSTARAATLQAARDLYGAGSNAERALTEAWTAVGVQ